MASYVDYLELYQSFSTEELTEERTRLMTARKGYLSQSTGTKSYSQDLTRVDAQLRALVRVQNERSHSRTPADSRGTVDFSQA